MKTSNFKSSEGFFEERNRENLITDVSLGTTLKNDPELTEEEIKGAHEKAKKATVDKIMTVWENSVVDAIEEVEETFDIEAGENTIYWTRKQFIDWIEHLFDEFA